MKSKSFRADARNALSGSGKQTCGGDLRQTANRLLSPEVAAEKKRLSEAYAAETIGTLVGLARRALADLRPARLSCGRSRAPRLSFGRRYRMKDGTVRTNPGVLNPDIVGVAGNPPDDEVQLLRIDRDGVRRSTVYNRTPLTRT